MSFELEMQRILRLTRPGLLGTRSNPSLNLLDALEELKYQPERLETVRAEAHEFLLKLDYVPALTQSGLSVESGFFSEVFKKLEYKMLPKAISHKDFVGFVDWLFSTSSGSLDWVEFLDVDVLSQFIELLVPQSSDFFNKLSEQLYESLEVISIRLAHLGVEPLIYERLKEKSQLKESFIKLPRDYHQFQKSRSPTDLEQVYHQLDLIEDSIEYIRSKRSTEGASLNLTFKLFRIKELSRRMRRILVIVERLLGEWKTLPLALLLKDILVSETRKFDIGVYFRRNMELVAYQITEHTGKTGDRYITTNRSEYEAMLKAAIIGGAIVGGVSIAKTCFSTMHFPPALEALIYGLVYAIGFLAVHNMHGVIATKQPAMTASRIAASLDQAKTSQQAMENLCEMIVRTIRSQMVALAGNFFIAFPVACLISLPFTLLEFPLISDEKAEAMLLSLHPYKSLSLWYAAVAGVCLFLAGIFAGVASNWFVFNNVARRLKSSPFLKRFVPPSGLDSTIDNISANLSYWVGNVSLGFMLGSMGTIGFIFGLPLDIRHITFASAQLGTALTHLEFQVPASLAIMLAFSVFAMGLVNLGVSFSLTLSVAVKSRRIRFSQSKDLFRLLMARLKTAPLDFILPPKEKLKKPS